MTSAFLDFSRSRDDLSTPVPEFDGAVSQGGFKVDRFDDSCKPAGTFGREWPSRQGVLRSF
jgi:hypothetical protein